MRTLKFQAGHWMANGKVYKTLAEAVKALKG